MPTCPSHLPGTMPSCLETFESETFRLREGLWGYRPPWLYRGTGFRYLLYMESLFCNKQLELIWPISVCLWGCLPMLHMPVLTLCGPELWLSLSDNHI